VGSTWEGPWFTDVYIEHKNVFGMTAQFVLSNPLNARHLRNRTVYEDWRNTSAVKYYQFNDQLIGPIFQFRMKGTF
jgi:hypothetical protein